MEEKQPLQPHQYPTQIKAFTAIVLILFAYTLLQTPHYYTAAKNYQMGETKLQEGKHQEAINYYQKTLDAVPTAKKAKISMAIAYFSNNNQTDDEQGLQYLEGISLDQDEWKKITKVMPQEYQKLFQTIKK